MSVKFLKFILPDWITSLKSDDNSSDVYNFIASSGVNYYLSGDASSDMVITVVSIQPE
jgi:hypothetical protein